MTQVPDHHAFPSQGPLSEQIDVLLQYAVRAPSTHNVQPWLFRVTGNKIELFLDPNRQLPQGDPSGSLAMISLGACFEHLVTSAKYFGMYISCVVTDSFAQETAVAEVIVKPSDIFAEELLPLIVAMETRFNARGQFEHTQIPDDVLAKMLTLQKEEGVYMDIFTGSDKNAYAELVVKGMRSIHLLKEFRKELSGWIRNNYSKHRDGIPGYTMLAPGPLSIALPYLIRFFNLGKVLGALNKKSIESTSAAVILSSHDDVPRDWFRIGRYFQRVSLYLASQDIRTSVYVAAIQDLTQRAILSSRLKEKQLPQFAFTVGYPKIQFTPTPRLSPEERTLNT